MCDPSREQNLPQGYYIDYGFILTRYSAPARYEVKKKNEMK